MTGRVLRPGAVRRRGLGDPRGMPTGRRRPTSDHRRGGVCPCRLGPSSPLPRIARQRQGAHSAPDPAAHDEQVGGLPHQRAPLCAPKGRFPEVAPRGRRVAVWRPDRRWGRGRGARFADCRGRRLGGRRAARMARLWAFQSRPNRGAGRRRGRRGRGRTPRRGVRRSGSRPGPRRAGRASPGTRPAGVRSSARAGAHRAARTSAGLASRLNGDAGGAALAEVALPFSGGEGHPSPIAAPLRNGASAAPMAPSTRSAVIAAARASGFRKSPTAAVRDDCGPDVQAFDRDLPASQRGGAAIDSFWSVDRDRGRRCPCSLSPAAGAIQGGVGNALHHGGTVLDERPARLRCRRQDAQALDAAGSSFARRGWRPSGVVPESSAAGLQGPLDSR